MRKVITSYGEKVKLISNTDNNYHKPFNGYTNIQKTVIEEHPDKKLQYTLRSSLGFVDAFKMAYENSAPLELKPDVFYIIIMQSLSKHIENNVDKYRHLFTKSKDKELLIEHVDEDDYQAFIDSIGKQLREKIKFDPTLNVSTSTTVSSSVNDITLMNVCKEYYNYMMITLSDSGYEIDIPEKEGITEFHIYGSVEDWTNLINKVNYIGTTFDLKFWTDSIVKVLSYIKKADPKDTSFWNGAYKHKSLLNLFKKNDIENGWFLAFFLYTDENTLTSWKKIGDKFGGEYPSQITSTPFVYIRYSKKMNMELHSGICGVLKDKITKAYSPCIGWAVIKLDSKVMSVIEENDVINL